MRIIYFFVTYFVVRYIFYNNLFILLLSYLIYKEPFTTDNACELPNKPIKEEWHVTNGSLQIETKVTGANITHTLKLIEAEFMKDDITFNVTDRNLGAYSLQ